MEKAIATNTSNYSWEDYYDDVTATVYLDERTSALRLEIVEESKNVGINPHHTIRTLVDTNIGTVTKPKLGNVASLLKRHTHQRSRASSPFKRQWRDVGNNKRSLGEIVADYIQAGVGDAGLDEQKRRRIVKRLDQLDSAELDALLAQMGIRASTASDRVARQFVAIRFKPRREYFIPKNKENVKKVTPPGTDIEMYLWEEGDKVYGMGFMGKQQKPFFNYIFRDERQRDQFVDKEIDSRKKTLRRKQDEREERQNFRHDYQIGDILYSSWGYDQTNVDFYEVVGVTEKSIVMRQVAQRVVREERGSDYVVAVPGKFTGQKMTKRVSPGGSVRMSSYSSAYKWDGKPKYQTAMGYGH